MGVTLKSKVSWKRQYYFEKAVLLSLIMLRPTTTWALSREQGKLEEAIEAYNKALSLNQIM